MNITAALRHERTNAKHLEKVQERIRNDWNYDPPSDWGPIPLPAGTTAWDQSWPADRAEDFIAFWLDNKAAEERGDKPETMDSFIDRFNKKYQDWLDSWYSGEAQAVDQVEEDEEEEDEGGREDGWKAVPGLWYDGGSFFPHEDGFHTVHHPSVPRADDNWSAQFKQEQWQACAADPTTEEWVIREDPREEYLAWGFTPDELPDFHASDATPPFQPQNTSPPVKTRGQKNPTGRRGKNRDQARGDGKRKKQGGGAVDAATRRTDARKSQRAKIY